MIESNKNNTIYQYADKLFSQGYDRDNIIKIVAQSFNYSSKEVENLLDNLNFSYGDSGLSFDNVDFADKGSFKKTLWEDMKDQLYVGVTKLPRDVLQGVVVSLIVAAAGAAIYNGIDLIKLKLAAKDAVKDAKTPEDVAQRFQDIMRSKYNISISDEDIHEALHDGENMSRRNFGLTLKNGKEISTGKLIGGITGAAVVGLILTLTARVLVDNHKNNKMFKNAFLKAAADISKDKPFDEKELDAFFDRYIKNLEDAGLEITPKTLMDIEKEKARFSNKLYDRDWAMAFSEANMSDQFSPAPSPIPANGKNAPPTSPLPPEGHAPDDGSNPNYQVQGTPGMDPNIQTIPQSPVGDQNVQYKPGQRIMDDKGNMGTIRTGNTKLRDNKGEFYAVEVYWDSGKCDFISTAYVGNAPTNEEIQAQQAQDAAAQGQDPNQPQAVNQSEKMITTTEKINYINGHGNYEAKKIMDNNGMTKTSVTEGNFSDNAAKTASQIEIEKFKKYGLVKNGDGKYTRDMPISNQIAASLIDGAVSGIGSEVGKEIGKQVAEMIGIPLRALTNIVLTTVRRTVKGDFRNAELNKQAVSEVATHLNKMIADREGGPMSTGLTAAMDSKKRGSLYVPSSFQPGNYSVSEDQDYELGSGEVKKNFRKDSNESFSDRSKDLKAIQTSAANANKARADKANVEVKKSIADAKQTEADAKVTKVNKLAFSEDIELADDPVTIQSPSGDILESGDESIVYSEGYSPAQKRAMQADQLAAKRAAERTKLTKSLANRDDARTQRVGAETRRLGGAQVGLYMKRGNTVQSVAKSRDQLDTKRSEKAGSLIRSNNGKKNDRMAANADKARIKNMNSSESEVVTPVCDIKLVTDEAAQYDPAGKVIATGDESVNINEQVYSSEASDIITPVDKIELVQKTELYGPADEVIDEGEPTCPVASAEHVFSEAVTPVKNDTKVEKSNDGTPDIAKTMNTAASSMAKSLERNAKSQMMNASFLEGPKEWYVTSARGTLGPMSEGEAHSKYMVFSAKDDTTRMYKNDSTQVGFSNFSESGCASITDKLSWIMKD